MSQVYRVSNEHGEVYVNTKAEAYRAAPGGEWPTTVDRLDAADECTRLAAQVEKRDREVSRLRRLLRGLREVADVCDSGVLWQTEEGRAAETYLGANPPPAADAADRDGQRSYSG